MNIERITRFNVDGQDFNSIEKAVDYCENKISEAVKRTLSAAYNGRFSANDCFEIAQTLISNRAEFAELLAFTLPDAEE